MATTKKEVQPKASGKRHVRQIGFSVMPEDEKIIQSIKSSEGFKTDADVIRYALMLVEHNAQLHDILVSHKNEIVAIRDEVKSMSWRNNQLFLVVMKIGRFLKVVPPEEA
jgi:hypothetical protein